MEKLLIIGCGAVTQELHLPSLVELERRGLLQVEALFDPSLVERSLVHQKFPKARLLDSLQSLLHSDLTLALIASPPRFHCEQAIACLEAGLAVLCEKPIASTRADAEAMVAAAQNTGKPLAVGHVRRFSYAAKTIKELVDSKLFGNIVGFSVREGSKFSWPARSAAFFQRGATGGGGVLLDTGIHTIDLLLWWLGQPTSFTYEDDSMGGIETTCRLSLEYGAFRGTVHLTWDYAVQCDYCLQFERAKVYWLPYEPDQIRIVTDGRSFNWHCTLESATPEKPPKQKPPPRLKYQHSFFHQWLNLIAAAQGTEACLSPAAEAIKSLLLVQECYAQRTFLMPPWLTNTEAGRAQELNRAN
jgi:predicted dehydrogenase